MKINFKYLVPIMVLACLNIALLTDFFQWEIYSNNNISKSIFSEQLAKSNHLEKSITDPNNQDSLKTKDTNIN